MVGRSMVDKWSCMVGRGMVDNVKGTAALPAARGMRARRENAFMLSTLQQLCLEVVVAIAVVSISWGWLVDSHHLGVTLFLIWNLNSLGSNLLLGKSRHKLHWG